MAVVVECGSVVVEVVGDVLSSGMDTVGAVLEVGVAGGSS